MDCDQKARPKQWVLPFLISEGTVMQILKILNNNAVISKDLAEKEIIVTGKGIAFQKNRFDVIDEKLIEKIFYPADKTQKTKLELLIQEIPLEYLSFTEDIIAYAQVKLKTKLDSNLLITLTDHIHYAIEKIKKGIFTPNLMLDEIRSFYRNEYDLGMEIVSQINERYAVKFDENEAGFIAFHLMNAQEKGNLDETIDMLSNLGEIKKIIEKYFDTKLDENSLDFSRFMIHLKFFMRKMALASPQQDKSLSDDALFRMLVEKYADINECLNLVDAYAYQIKKYHLSDSDRMYLIIHLARLLKSRN